MAAPDRDRLRWNFGDLCRKLRQSHGWSMRATATRAGLTRHDILTIETDQHATVESHIQRIRALERAFRVNLFDVAYQAANLTHSHPSIRTPAKVIPFALPSTGVHQNSMFWSYDGVLLDVVEYSPLYRLAPIAYLRKFIGLTIPTPTRVEARRTTPVSQGGWVAAGTLFAHLHRLIKATARNQPTPPFRYRSPNTENPGQFVTRVITVHRKSAAVLETRTHVLPSPRETAVDLEIQPTYLGGNFGARHMRRGPRSRER